MILCFVHDAYNLCWRERQCQSKTLQRSINGDIETEKMSYGNYLD